MAALETQSAELARRNQLLTSVAAIKEAQNPVHPPSANAAVCWAARSSHELGVACKHVDELSASYLAAEVAACRPQTPHAARLFETAFMLSYIMLFRHLLQHDNPSGTQRFHNVPHAT